ncbi:MAG: carboxypeptidase regulatory-like domain-containing protein [Bryobacteraceae bacterium]|jgi:hypothetical protein
MRFGRFSFPCPAALSLFFRALAAISLIALFSVASTQAVAQSLLAGDIAGTVTDPSGAVVPNANVSLKSLDTGGTQATTTSSVGYYRFSLVRPGHYVVTASQTGFQQAQRPVNVAVGQVANADLTLEVGSATQTVEVQGLAPLLNTEQASMNTYFTPTELAQLPSAGGDITNIADTVPGVVVNVTAGYGNFTVNGLPATSNLYTVNGENDMDPYFNINNSGATNLTLGQNELQEATVITSPYDGQYGQLSGAQVVYVTKSGSNEFHGNAQYFWNGRAMNANDWFNNATDTPRAFSNSNQWAASLGGPIRKNSTFFFVDHEGLRFVLPNVISTTIPTPAFASAVLANVTAKQPAEAATYQKMLNLWLSAPGASSAVPEANSAACNALVLPGFDPSTQNCAARFEATPTALASEWILAARVDQKLGDKDNLYYRYRLDHGVQPTLINAISPAFNAISNQPAWDNQLNETHIFGARATNQAQVSASHYVAQFAQNHQLAYSTFPYSIIDSGVVPFTQINYLYDFPQGRNITQYQFLDDYTLALGKHSLKFGANYRRYDVSDHNFYWNDPAVYFGYTTNGLQNFSNGIAYQYRKSLNLASDVPIAMWGLGVYAHDTWRVSPNFTLTLALRAEHNSNPVCQINCFANAKGDFSSLASVTSSSPGSVPYASDINYNQHQAFPGMDAINLSPRVGVSWSPFKDRKTVISGGFGIFYDAPAEGLLDNSLTNPPVSVAIRVRVPAGVLGFDPAGAAATWAQSAQAFSITQSYSTIAAELKALGSVFTAPALTSFVGTYHAPRWEEWTFQLQRELTQSTALILSYAGNHGGNIPYANSWPNAWDAYGLFPGVSGINPTAAVPNYGVYTQWKSGAISNYDGLTVTFRENFSHGLAVHFNYTWSHNLDETSNGGVFTYGDSQTLQQINPTNLRANNYGNSDYDIRHLISADFVYNPAVHVGNAFLGQLLNGWEYSGKAFWRTGLPFTVTDGNWAGALLNSNVLIPAQAISGNGQTSCGAADTWTSGGTCLNAAAFIDSAAASFNGYTTFPSQTRNQYHGPHYFSMDMALFRAFHLGEKRALSVGLQAYNVFNHPNFGLPDSGLGDSTFGQITGMVSTPTSPYGNFLGFDASPRIVQVSGKFVF